MEFGEIFKDALKYPTLDYQKLLILGVLYVIINIPAIIAQFGFKNNALSLIFMVVSIFLNLIIFGFVLGVIRNAIDLDDAIPDFEWTKNLVDGIKYFVVGFVYYLIPTIIVTIIGVASLSAFFGAIGMDGIETIANATSTDVIMNTIPPEAWSTLASGLAITAIVAIILFLIFGLFKTVGLCRLAKYETLGEAFNFSEVINDIKEIGVLRLFGFLIVLVIICAILGMVIGLISAIPYIGIIIGYLVGNSFIALFYNRSVGLLYSDI